MATTQELLEARLANQLSNRAVIAQKFEELVQADADIGRDIVDIERALNAIRGLVEIPMPRTNGKSNLPSNRFHRDRTPVVKHIPHGKVPARPMAERLRTLPDNSQTLQCNHCGHDKLLDAVHFNPDKSNPLGFEPRCRACRDDMDATLQLRHQMFVLGQGPYYAKEMTNEG